MGSNCGDSYLYVLGANATSVEIFSLDGPAKAKQIATVNIQSPARAAGVTISKFGRPEGDVG